MQFIPNHYNEVSWYIMQALQAYQLEIKKKISTSWYCGILCYVHLVQRALFACMTFQASLLKMRLLYEVKTIVKHNILGHAHMLASSTTVVNVKRDHCAKVHVYSK